MQLAGISNQGSPLGPGTQQQQQQEDNKRASDILNATTHELKLEKSNILLLGPTGSGRLQETGSKYIPINWDGWGIWETITLQALHLCIFPDKYIDYFIVD